MSARAPRRSGASWPDTAWRIWLAVIDPISGERAGDSRPAARTPQTWPTRLEKTKVGYRFRSDNTMPGHGTQATKSQSISRQAAGSRDERGQRQAAPNRSAEVSDRLDRGSKRDDRAVGHRQFSVAQLERLVLLRDRGELRGPSRTVRGPDRRLRFRIVDLHPEQPRDADVQSVRDNATGSVRAATTRPGPEPVPCARRRTA